MANLANTTRRDTLKGALAFSVASIGTAAVAAEMAGLFDVIDHHRTAYALFGALTPFTDEIDERYDPSRHEEYQSANEAEIEALKRVIDYKTETLGALRAKARYIAEVDNMGSLNYEQAFEFIHSIAGV